MSWLKKDPEILETPFGGGLHSMSAFHFDKRSLRTAISVNIGLQDLNMGRIEATVVQW